MQFEYDEAKFSEFVLLVAGRLASDRAGGATKLNKVLYFADFAHVRRHGRPITGAEYQKLPQGPAPRRLRPVREALIRKGDATIVIEDFLGYEMHRLVPLREPDLDLFEPAELETVERVLSDLANLIAKRVSDLSHDEPGWRFAQEGDTIPYHMAIVPKQQVVTPTAVELASSVAKRYGISR